MMEHKCEGACETHIGEVKYVHVHGKYDWGNFWYCSVAINYDRNLDYLVDELPNPDQPPAGQVEMLWKFAYADPPYIGCAHLYPENTEVDHNELLSELMNYDAWALSTHVPGLRTIMMLPNFPEVYRLGAWVKPFAVFKPGVNPGYAWEPVIFYGGRRLGRDVPTVRDWVSANITMQRGLVGAKPEAFCYWLFDMLGVQKDDEFVDLYPGTGAVTEAWMRYRGRLL